MSFNRNLKYYYVSAFIVGLVFIIPIWVAFERRILNYSQMALLEVVGSSFLIILQLPTGALADLIGRKKTIFLGWCLTGFGNILFSQAATFPHLIGAYLIVNFGFALVSGADVALIYDSLKEIGRTNEFQKIVSKKSLIYQIAMVVGTLTGGYLYHVWFRLPFMLYGILEIIGGSLILFMKEPHIDSEKFTLKSYVAKNQDGFKEIFKTSHLKKLTLFYILVGGLTWSAQFYFNQPFATDIGFSIVEKGWFFALLRLVNSIILFKLVSVASLITKKRAFLIFPIVMIFAYAPGIFATKITGAVMVWISVFIATARFAILDKHMNDEFESRHRATALSALSMIVSLIYVLMMLVAVPVMQIYSTKMMFTILGLLTILFVLPVGVKLWKEEK